MDSTGCEIRLAGMTPGDDGTRGPACDAAIVARSTARTLLTFAGVGLTATVLYFVLASTASALFQAPAAVCSVVAYLLSAILSYYGHKHLSFVSSGAHLLEAPRFVAATGLGLLLAYLIPMAVERVGWPHVVAYMAVCLIVPAVNFVLLKSWVFRTGALPGGNVIAKNTPKLLGWGLAFIGVAFVIQATVWETNPDTSWLITVIERMHAGDRLYVDVVDNNPPMSIWLYVIPVYFADAIGLSPELAVNAYVLLTCFGGIALTGWIVRAGNLVNGRALVPTLGCMLFAATILVGNAFSERDHIGVVLLTPMIALAAWRSTGAVHPRPKHWLVAGGAGAVITLVKPYYALIVVAAAAYVVVKRRDARLFFLPEFLIAGATTVGYFAIAYLSYPDFFEKLLPSVRETYMAYSEPLGILVMLLVQTMVLPLVYVFLVRRGGRTVLGDLLLISAGVALIPFFIQGKGWPYHAYPAVYLGSVAVITAACKLLFAKQPPGYHRATPAEILSLMLVALFAAHLRFYPDGAPPRAFAGLVRAEMVSPTVGMLGGDIASGHPLARMIGGRWIEPYCSDWLAVYALRLEREALRQGNGARAQYFEAMMDRYLAEKRGRLEKSPPQILIVDRGDGLVGMMLAGHGFDALLANYVKLASYQKRGEEVEVEVYRLVSPPGMEPAL